MSAARDAATSSRLSPGDETSWLRTVSYPLWRLFRVTRFEVIDGVTIDLRHPLIDPWRWRTEVLWTDPMWGWSNGPRVWFPWFGPCDEIGIGADLLRQDASSQDDFEEQLTRFLPTACAAQGCRIEVQDVKASVVGGDFDHEHDREVRDAYLQIQSPGGGVVRLIEPIRFVGATAFAMEHQWRGVTLDKVAARICDELNLPALEAFELIVEQVSSAELSFLEAKWLTRDLEARLADLPAWYEASSRNVSQEDLIGLVNLAISLGYHWAQAEDEVKLVPLAATALASARGAELGGVRSGQSRRRKAQATWHPHALELAQQSRRENPSGSQDMVVADIQSAWKLESPSCPGSKTLKIFVSAKERSAELPARKV